MENFTLMPNSGKPLKIAYLHRPSYHPMHGAYAKSVGAEFIRIDKFIPETLNEKNKLKVYARMFLNGLFSPARRYDVIITDEVKPEAAIMKLTSFKKKRLITTQASYTLTRMYEKKLTAFNTFILKKIIKNYDVVMCVGDELYNIARKMCSGNPSILISKIYNGVSEDRIGVLSKNEYNPMSRTVVSIANCFSPETFHYKGMDIMISVFDKLLESHPDLNYLVLGYYTRELNEEALARYPERTRQRIVFKPFNESIVEYLSQGVLYLQLSRYEAFGIAVAEAAFAGIPVFISDQVGARIILDGLDNRNDFIIQNENATEAAQKIIRFLNLPPEAKKAISQQTRTAVQPFSEHRAVQAYKEIFEARVGLQGSGVGNN